MRRLGVNCLLEQLAGFKRQNPPGFDYNRFSGLRVHAGTAVAAITEQQFASSEYQPYIWICYT